MTQDARYPYSYSADLVRGWAGHNANGSKISRSDARNILHNMAKVLDIDAEDLASKLADFYLVNENKISEAQAQSILNARREG